MQFLIKSGVHLYSFSIVLNTEHHTRAYGAAERESVRYCY